MAYSKDRFEIMAAGSPGRAANVFLFRNQDGDSLDDMQQSGYWDQAIEGGLRNRDFIFVSGTTGEAVVYWMDVSLEDATAQVNERLVGA